MPINKTLITFLLFLIALSASFFSIAKGKRSTRIRPVVPYNRATLSAPPNMVYIRGGSTTIKYNSGSTNDSNSTKKVSLTSFFIDKTEITNQQYRQFTEWVIDSIAVVKYLKDDKYFMEAPREITGNTSNTNETNTNNGVGQNTTDTTGKGGNDMPKSDAIVSADENQAYDPTRRRINWSKVSHKKIFDTKDQETRSKLAPLLDENGEIRRDAYTFAFTYLKTINTTATGSKEKTKKYVTEALNIYPDEKTWAEDMSNSQTDLLVENYFKIPPYDDYPVVGVTWKQARAFSYWRSITANSYKNMPDFMKYYHLTYTLPTEAQWVYAASGYYDMVASNSVDTSDNEKSVDTTVAVKPTTDSSFTPHDSLYTALAVQAAMRKSMHTDVDTDQLSATPAVRDSTPIHMDKIGLLSNFKQDEGDYWEDGSALTLPVMAYAPNEFGIYNMEGNVSEWVMDAYSPSTFSFVSDLNPQLLYDADSSDADAMHRKVVRGGSFMSNAKQLSPYYRDIELDYVSHCYIGFRCVMQAPEILYSPVKTRKKRLQGPSTDKLISRD